MDESLKQWAKEVAEKEVRARVRTLDQAKEDYRNWIETGIKRGGYEPGVIEFWNEVLRNIHHVGENSIGADTKKIEVTPYYVPQISLCIDLDVYKMELISFYVIDSKTLNAFQLFYHGGLGFFLEKNGVRLNRGEIEPQVLNTFLNLNFTVAKEKNGPIIAPN